MSSVFNEHEFHEFIIHKNHKNTASSSEAVGQSCSFRLLVHESELSHNSLNIHYDVPSLSRLAKKTSRFALKNIISVVGLMASKSFENTVENLSIQCE